MNLSCETILDFYTLKNKKVFCQISFASKSNKLKNTCRCLSQEQWLIFDKELEKLVAAKDCWNDKRGIKFNIESNIQVKVQKSKLSAKIFFKCFNATGGFDECDTSNVIESILVLECLIDFQQEVSLLTSTDSQEYQPQIETLPDGNLCIQIYEPYTPSKCKNLEADTFDTTNNPGIDLLECSDDTYSPLPVFEIAAREPFPTNAIPPYTPAPINNKQSLQEMKKPNNNAPNEDRIEMDTEINSVNKHKTLKTKSYKKSKSIRCEYIPKGQEVATANVPIYIPTPIEKTTTSPNTFNIDSMRINRKRSITIDVFPKAFEYNNKERQTSKVEQIKSNEKYSDHSTKKLIKRSMSIDEMSAALTNVPAYIPAPIKESVLTPCNYRKSTTSSKTEVVFLNSLDENLEENYIDKKEQLDKMELQNDCKRKQLEKDFSSVHEMATKAVAESKEKLKSHISPKKHKRTKRKSERISTMSVSSGNELTAASYDQNLKSILTRQTIVSDRKFKDNNKIDKTIKLQKLLNHSSTFIKTAEVRKEIQSEERKKSLRRSERTPSKPTKFVEDDLKICNKNNTKRIKPSPKNKELFGTDDDDDDDCFKKSDNKNITNLVKTKARPLETTLDKKSASCNSFSSTARQRNK